MDKFVCLYVYLSRRIKRHSQELSRLTVGDGHRNGKCRFVLRPHTNVGGGGSGGGKSIWQMTNCEPSMPLVGTVVRGVKQITKTYDVVSANFITPRTVNRISTTS